MTTLNTAPNLAQPDEFYARLIASHEGLSKPESDALNARLVLILANHIGEVSVLDAALELAQDTRSDPNAT